MNFNINKLEITLPELINILRKAESTIKKEKPILYTSKTIKKKKTEKSLEKGKGNPDRVKQRLS